MREFQVLPSAIDRLTSRAYLSLARLAAMAGQKRINNRRLEAPLGFLFLGHGMNHHGSIEYSGTPLEVVESWLEQSLACDNVDLASFRRGDGDGYRHFASIPWQYQVVYRDGLIHFFATLCYLSEGASAMDENGPDAGSFLPLFHSSGVCPLVYMSGSASLKDALRFSEKGAELLDEEEEVRSAEDLEKFLPLLGTPSELLRKSIARMRHHVATVLKGVPGCLEAFDLAVKQRGLNLGASTRELLRRAIRARLVALSGFGPRPYTKADADLLVTACREQGLAVEISVVNADNLIVLGGPSYDLAVAEVLAREGTVGRRPFMVSRIVVDGSPHTLRYETAAGTWRDFLNAEIRAGNLIDPMIPFVGHDGRIVNTAEGVRDALTGLLNRTFVFQDACRTFLNSRPRALLVGLGQGSTPGQNIVEASILNVSRSFGAIAPPVLRTSDLFLKTADGDARRIVTGKTASSCSDRSELTFDRLDAVRLGWERRLSQLRQARPQERPLSVMPS